MERYYAKKSIQTLYRIIGISALGLLILIIFETPYNKLGLGLFTQLVLYALTLLVAILHFLRPKRCYFELNEDEIYFHDGLLGRIRIQYDLIKSIDYHQDLKFRITLKKQKKRQIEIPNIFTIEDQGKILKSLRKKRKTIKVNYWVKPDSIFVRNKTNKIEK